MQYYVTPDGYAVNGESGESKFLDALELSAEVVVYAKLPKGFAIPTPLGNYSPDWAIAFDKDKSRYVYFVAETKGSTESIELRPIEKVKIDCAKILFEQISQSLKEKGEAEIHYDAVESFEKLCAIIQVAPKAS